MILGSAIIEPLPKKIEVIFQPFLKMKELYMTSLNLD
jgi:hypothetical protein